MSNYDSARDTIKHSHYVFAYGERFIKWLKESMALHDMTKLFSPEKEILDEYIPIIGETTYGSGEYKEAAGQMQPMLDHHYAHPLNRHHPEHFEHGITNMNLMDIVEMLCDWKAATRRHEDGDLKKSLEINIERFDIEPQLAQIMLNTIEELGW